jgi:hypothetical protein
MYWRWSSSLPTTPYDMQAFWMLQSIIAGGFYFDEFAELSGWRAAAFSVGLLAAIAGAVGMGCASFVAEQHVMISYTVLPGRLRLLAHSNVQCMLHMNHCGLGSSGTSSLLSLPCTSAYTCLLQLPMLVACRIWDGRRFPAGPHPHDGIWPAVCGAGRTPGAHGHAAAGLEPPQVGELPSFA